ncbi:MAG: L-lactate dehydrogenase [Burkholderiales bacterium]|nr:L-lactate dehydrogenase [Burkholderiales bacterium]
MAAGSAIGIIGTGWVGASVAISVLQSGTARELLLYDKREAVAEGEAMDLSHGSSFYPAASVRSAPPEAMRSARAVVIAAGRGGGPQESRLDLLRDNAAIVRELARGFAGYEGIVVMVTNPVDVLTYVFQQASGLPAERVIGTGTMLDTARLRQVLGRELDLDPRAVHAQVAGEHGDSEVVLWSSATLGGIRLRRWPGWDRAREAGVAQEVRRAAYEIIRRKGATNHAIGLVTATLLRWMLRGERRILTVSRAQSGALGLHGVALSLPTVVGAGGASEVLEPELDGEERAGLERSAQVIREAIASAS